MNTLFLGIFTLLALLFVGLLAIVGLVVLVAVLSRKKEGINPQQMQEAQSQGASDSQR